MVRSDDVKTLGNSNVHSFLAYYTRSMDNFVLFHFGTMSPLNTKCAVLKVPMVGTNS